MILSLRSRGFSLIELMVTLTIAAIVFGLGIAGLGKARTAGNSRGLATAVAAELRYAREKAISSGSPVAVVFPNGVGRSLFWLEGATDPVVSRSSNFEGDYPQGAVTVATYPGPSFEKNAAMPGFKGRAWSEGLDAWLPDKYKNHFVFMFTPNGSVVTNDLPSADGSYRVIVGTGAEITPTAAPVGEWDWVSGNDNVYYTLNASGEPYTVAISLSGSVEYDKGLAGWNQSGVSTAGGKSQSVTAPPKPEVTYQPKLPKIIHRRITPPAEELDGELVHVLDKGEYLTLEVFAQSQDGKPLFAGWNDTPTTKKGDSDFKGRFSVPNGALERMEFYPEFDIKEDGVIVKNVWRSVWTWTPPPNAEAGDRYSLEVDVKDAKQTLSATIPDLPPVTVAPPGEIVFERRVGGRWQLFTMWADGSRQKRLSKGPHDYRCASATANGRFIAYERNGNEVWVMNSDGTGEIKVANGRVPTISPTGNSIAYMTGSLVVVRRLDSKAGAPTSTESSQITTVTGAPNPSNRIAYSPDGKWVYFTAPGGNGVAYAQLSFPGEGIAIVNSGPASPVPNVNINAGHKPQVGGLSTGRGGELYYHADDLDPYLGQYGMSGFAPTSVGTSFRKSIGQNECYPAISPNEDLLLFCQEVGGRYQIFRTPKGNWMNSGVEKQLTEGEESLRPAWIQQRERF